MAAIAVGDSTSNYVGLRTASDRGGPAVHTAESPPNKIVFPAVVTRAYADPTNGRSELRRHTGPRMAGVTHRLQSDGAIRASDREEGIAAMGDSPFPVARSASSWTSARRLRTARERRPSRRAKQLAEPCPRGAEGSPMARCAWVRRRRRARSRGTQRLPIAARTLEP